jgi:DNA polymerase-3 subunit epsilon
MLARLFGAGREPAQRARWVVVDCETTGLDASRDRLLSIGAVAVRAGRVELADAFSRLVRQPQPSSNENILVHGIGAQAQASGDDPRRVLEDFVGFAGQGPLVAFHAPFDRAMLERAARAQGLRWRTHWLDVAELLRVMFRSHAGRCRGLDDWLRAFGIAHDARHDALGDAFATAQLTLIALEEARRHGFATVAEVMRASRDARWSGA